MPGHQKSESKTLKQALKAGLGVQADRAEEAPPAQAGRTAPAAMPQPSQRRPSQPIAMSGTPSSYKVRWPQVSDGMRSLSGQLDSCVMWGPGWPVPVHGNACTAR